MAQMVIDDPALYMDVHCWVFTPRGFAKLMAKLAQFDLLHLACAGFTDTRPEHGFEFYVFLTPSSDRGEIIESWNRMAAKALHPLPGSAAALAMAEAEASARRTAEELANAKARIAALEASSSWRITSPLRRIVQAFRG